MRDNNAEKFDKWAKDCEEWGKKQQKSQAKIGNINHIHYRIFDILAHCGIILAAAITATAVLAAASPWAQMGAFLGFSALYALVGEPLLTALFRREAHEKATHGFIPYVLGQAISHPFNGAIILSIAIGCGLSFWGGFATMNAVYVLLAVQAGFLLLSIPKQHFDSLAYEKKEREELRVTSEQSMELLCVATTAAQLGQDLAKKPQPNAVITGMPKAGEENWQQHGQPTQ
jgi:hypothetical protein